MVHLKKTFSTLLICLICVTTYGDRFKAVNGLVTFVAGSGAAKCFGDNLETRESQVRLENQIKGIALGVVLLIVALSYLRKVKST